MQIGEECDVYLSNFIFCRGRRPPASLEGADPIEPDGVPGGVETGFDTIGISWLRRDAMDPEARGRQIEKQQAAA